ncbi:hypothetical protein [Streptomyces sp. NPDC048516]|uniref:DUF6197 family protein n=1 Tax=Streptomyces sp. NPDC048516 TaxID=3365565 RepID=UPI0037125B45
MSETARILQQAARLIGTYGLHTGPQFAGLSESFSSLHAPLDVCAAIYIAAEGKGPSVFQRDEDASLRLIECSAPTMQAIRVLSNALDTEPPFIQITDDHTVAEYVQHVSRWASTPQFSDEQPPTEAEVIGRILRTADTLDAPRALAA